MSIWNAVLLGVIQGIAEFLPISSSGHFAVVNNLFKLSDLSQGHALFQAMLYLATIVSACLVYWPEICAMVYEMLSFADLGPLAGQERARYPAARCFFLLLIATLPLFLALPINSRMEVLNGRNIFIGVMLILTGRRDFAVTFSFLLSIPAVFGAAILSFVDAVRAGIDWHCVPAYLVGTAAAIFTGVVSIHLMRYISRKKRFGGFAYYCWVIGVLLIILHLIF